MTVTYKPIEGYPGYRVGDDGSVWSCWTRGSSATWYIGTDWHILHLRPANSGNGLEAKLYQNGIQKTFKVHRLVLEAFIGPCPLGMEACHAPDKSYYNTNLSNLRWGTKISNAADKILHGTDPCGVRNPNAKLNEHDIESIFEEYNSGKYTQKEIGENHGITQTHVGYIVNGHSWKHLKHLKQG